jgi:phosphatidylserine/phosphatidylglycerophosphate/cardiolipin synthase-like enzyme
MSTSAHAYLVESIPKGLEDLRGTPGVAYTEDVLVQLTSSAKSSIDLTAMYWALLADPGSEDGKGFTPEQLDAMGAGAGRALYEALRAAAERGVRIRILQGPGFSGDPQESDTLRADFPDRISIHSVEMGKWYGGGGIMHQKVWIVDQRHLYVGSANMDWKSITQVKEMGVVVEDCPDLAGDAAKYFEAWWAFAALSPTSVQVFDPVARINRCVPPWSILVPAEQRAQLTLAGGKSETACNWKAPLSLDLGGERGTVLLTGCPREVLDPGRTWDQEGLVRTIDGANPYA